MPNSCTRDCHTKESAAARDAKYRAIVQKE
jgi:hypothetical protein